VCSFPHIIEAIGAAADSSGHRNGPTRVVGNRLPVERLARPLVQVTGNRIELTLGDRSQVGLAGQVLAEKPVGVLVGTPLPRTPRIAKKIWTPVATVKARCSAISSP
jgi:hypothetical protein